jgi:hypothetical protein
VHVHVAFLAATTVHEYALLDAGKICGSWEVRGNGDGEHPEAEDPLWSNMACVIPCFRKNLYCVAIVVCVIPRGVLCPLATVSI